MDPSSLPLMSDEGEMSWADHCMSSDESMRSEGQSNQSPVSSNTNWMTAASVAQVPITGHHSPTSSNMDMHGPDAASAPAIHPPESSRTDSWNSTQTQTSEEGGEDANAPWDQGSDDILHIPKLEPLDDDFNLHDITEAPTADETSNLLSQPKQKRPRGRPRKHPLTTVASASKVTKGRSKTGCITCRKRKKKCDEAKPRCMNCEKNAVVCEGYHEKKLWKSGKDKSGDEQSAVSDTVVFNMQPLFHAVVSAEDRIFWRHYYVNLSNVLTVEGEAKNAFKDVLLPLANQHKGVMHSILAMSSKHIDYDTPYGANLLQQHPGTSRQELEKRSVYHHDQAVQTFYDEIQVSEDNGDADHKTIVSARYAQIMCLLISTLIDGSRHGEHRVHLSGYQRLIQQSPPEDSTILTFITEFFQYHVFVDYLIWHPGMEGPRLTSHDSAPAVAIESPRLLGVADGLFNYLPQIATIRDTIRSNIYHGAETKVDYHLLWRAQDIQEAIDLWTPSWPVGDSRYNTGLIYKHMMFLHLFRTIYPPTALDHQYSKAPPAGAVAPVSPASSRRPSQVSRPMTASSSDSSPGFELSTAPQSATAFQQQSPPGSRNPSRTNSMHESDSTCGSQPSLLPRPTSRRPSHHDARITTAVDQSLTIMERFKPSDPALTLLLVPCQVLGAACFEPDQQERIRAVIKRVRGYTGMRNCDRVMEVLTEVWRLMDEGEWLSVWDWQGVARKLEVDFLCT